MIRRLAAALHAGMFALVGTSAIAADVELRVLNAFDPNYPATGLVLERYMEAVQTASNGRIGFRVSGPEVVKPFEQMEPVSRGVFDIMFTSPPYHSGTTSVGTAFYALEPDPAGYRTNGLYEALDADYQRFNLKLLGLIYGEEPGRGGFQIVLKRPLGPDGDLSGLKIRATKTHQPFIESLGGATVQLSGGEIYSSLEKGVIDGAAWPLIGVLDYKWYEVAKYLARPAYGHTAYSLTINLDRFKSLSAEDQKLLIEEAKRQELEGMHIMYEHAMKEVAKLKELGMEEVQFSEEKYNATMAKYYDGLWKSTEEHRASAEHVVKLRDLARKLGQAR